MCSVGHNAVGVALFYFISWNSEHKIRTHSYLKKTQHRWRCSFACICRQGNSLRSPTLPYKERNPCGVHSPPQSHTIRNNKNHIGVNFSFKRKSGAEDICRIDEPHRGSAFDSPELANDSAGYPGLIRSMEHNAIGVALFWLIRHESPRYNHVFSKKAQHLQRWISLLTQGRLVPRQPWAIKRTTPTALRGCNIRHGGFIL